ncbi:hypothetical protein ACFL9T_16110 [Thermodesulfobacteriota bacterium]
MKIYDHKYMEFLINDDRLDFNWKPETENMSDHEFQYAILRYASFVMEYNSKKVLIDLTNLKFNPSEESGKFHSDFVTIIYNRVGVKKKVFVAPSMEDKIIGKEPGTDYDNAFMKSYNEAVEWLNS